MAFNSSSATGRREDANSTVDIAPNTLAYVFTPLGLLPLDEYIAAAGIAGDPDGPLFRTTGRKTGQRGAMWQQDAYRMIQRRARGAGIQTRISNHTFRATGITVYLKGKGLLEHAQTMANHASPRTTKLYDRRSDEISLDEVEKISI